MIQQYRRKWGFTLLEVLVALVILSIAFTAIFKAISSNAKSLLYLQNKTAASWIALNIIAEIQLKLIALSENSQQSHQDAMFNRLWYWNAIVQATPNPSISRIDVSVKQTTHSSEIIHLVGYLRNEIP